MIKPITFQGTVNFKASLYALEIKSRFIDQDNAHGFFANYGDELNCVSVSSNKITIGTGAFVIQGRMAEVTSQEQVTVSITRNHVGYILAVINTYQLDDVNDCKFVSRTDTTFEDLDKTLIQEDTYAFDADTVNKTYELPIFKFEIDSNGSITNVTKIIQVIDDYKKIYNLIQEFKTIMTATSQASEAAVLIANNAINNSTEAKETSELALEHSNEAKETASQASQIADVANTKSDAAIGKVNELETQVVNAQGTKVIRNSEYVAQYDADENITTNDVIILDGGGSTGYDS